MRRRDRVYEWLRAHPLIPDALLVLGLFLFLAVPSSFAYEPGWPQQLAINVAMYGALVFRRVRPVASFTVVTVAGLVQWAAEIDLTPADAAVLLAMYSISAYGPRWASRAGLAVGILAAVLASQRFVLMQGGAGAFLTGVGVYSAAVIGCWALGDVRRVRQAYLHQLVDRAQQAERERDQRAQIAAADERARIAREMHDIIAHNLSVIVAQADGGRYGATTDPRSSVRALDTIATTGRSALDEMRRLLGILHTDGEDAGERVPQPGLGDVAGMVESFRSTGLQVDLAIDGTAPELPDGASLAIYRATQEALTNALKHAGPEAKATVMLTFNDDGVHVEVADDGRGAAAASTGGGMGLPGMEERLALYGGRVDAGPRAGGGWRVSIALPVDAGPRDTADRSAETGRA